MSDLTVIIGDHTIDIDKVVGVGIYLRKGGVTQVRRSFPYLSLTVTTLGGHCFAETVDIDEVETKVFKDSVKYKFPFTFEKCKVHVSSTWEIDKDHEKEVRSKLEEKEALIVSYLNQLNKG